MRDATGDTLTGLSKDADGHFRLYVYAVVARMLANLELSALAPDAAAGAGDPFAAFPFVAGYRAALQAFEPEGLPPASRGRWWDEQVAAWEDTVDGHLPLRALVADGGLRREQVRLLIAAGLVEEDIRFGALFAALQEPLVSRRPCTGLLNWLLAEPEGGDAGDGTAGDSWPLIRELLDLRLLIAENRSEPRSEWTLRVPVALWDAMRGRAAERPLPGVVLQAAASFPDLDGLILPPELCAQLVHLAPLLAAAAPGDAYGAGRPGRGGPVLRALVLRGMQGVGRRTALGALAAGMGKDVLLWEGQVARAGRAHGGDGALEEDHRGAGDPAEVGEASKLLGPLATLTAALPVLRLDVPPGETVELPALGGYRGPVGITLGNGGGLRGPLVEQSLTLTLPPPDRAARARFWEAAGVAFEAGQAGEVLDDFLLTGGHIRRAATLAATHAALAGRSRLIADDVRAATRSLNRQVLETLAAHLPPAGGWHELVVGQATGRELAALEARCRLREALRDQAGPAFERSLNRGVRALFSGPSGTGKTLAARALAASLQMDIYRVDLAAVVNKYIGETERNLNQVLSRAEELDVILLLDEGDALMTRRTDVRNANDRYANLETNYLLQRLETYEGIAIITTNAGQRIDTAFLRRLDVIVDFTPPDAAERWQIWQAHLPLDHGVSPAFLDEIASRCSLTGGQIRNAALHATLLAGGEAGALVRDEHLAAALEREYRKAGAAYPMAGLNGHGDGGHLERLRRFAGAAG